MGALLVAANLAGAGHRCAGAEAPEGELARKLANPLASLVSVPVQVNRDGGIGPDAAERTTVNLQPVVPIALGSGSRWKLISRTVLPWIEQAGGPHGARVSGFGDVTQSVYVTPIVPTRGGWLVGLGPVVQAPTGTEVRVTSDRWSAGPTGIAVRQAGPWAYGLLANHLWSMAGDGDAEVSTTFVQPFVNYVTRTRTTIALNTEATRDWTTSRWSVPVHLMVNQLVRVGPQPASIFAGVRTWATSPAHAPDGTGYRLGITLLFPAPRPKGGSGTAN